MPANRGIAISNDSVPPTSASGDTPRMRATYVLVIVVEIVVWWGLWALGRHFGS